MSAKHLGFFIVCTFLLLSSSQRPTRVVFFGDSITEAADRPPGYLTQLRDSLAAQGRGQAYELLGSGIGGNKVYDLFLRLEPDVLAREPDQVFIFVGVNDVWHKVTHRTGTDAPKFRQFYAALIEKLQARGIDVVLCTPGCIGERPRGDNPLDDELDAYSDIVRDLARHYNLPLVDIRQTFMHYAAEHNTLRAESGVLTTDGVHLNETGYRLLTELFLEKLKR